MELSQNRLKNKNMKTQNVTKTINENNSNSKVIKESVISNMHIIVNTKDKFLFLHTFLKKFSDKPILVLFSTSSQAKVNINIIFI
jgi:hypothetical protein